MNRIVLPLSLLLVLSLTLSVEAQKRRQRNRNVGITTLAAHPAVHKELKLKDKQVIALKEAVAEARKGFRESQKLKGDARRMKGREVNQKLRGVIAKHLCAAALPQHRPHTPLLLDCHFLANSRRR